ncbi:MAG: transposase [Methanosphaera sp.]|nr:transposase [Methanosphaera sp.]
MLLTAQEVYEEISSCNKDNLQNAINSILKKINKGYKSKNRTLIVDGSSADTDINFGSKKVTKKSIEDRDYKWAWGTALGWYLGFKITLVLDYDTKMPVLFLLSSGSPHDTKMVPLILKELKRRKLISTGDKILLDRGYYSYYNYKIALKTYKIIPLILVKGKLNMKKMNSIFSYPLDYFYNKRNTNKLKREYKKLVNELMANLPNRKVIKYKRSIIEDYFKFIKEGLGFKHLHKYTFESMHKATSLIVLLSGLIIHYCVDTKNDFQMLSESNISRTLNNHLIILYML